MLLPVFMAATERMICSDNCGKPIEVGQSIILFRGIKTFAKHQACVDKRRRLARRRRVSG